MRAPPALIVGGALALLFFGLAALSLVWTPYDVTKLTVAMRLRAPGAEHLFGTDHFGRDVFSMVMVGARTSVAVAVVAVGIGMAAGVPLGLAAASRSIGEACA